MIIDIQKRDQVTSKRYFRDFDNCEPRIWHYNIKNEVRKIKQVKHECCRKKKCCSCGVKLQPDELELKEDPCNSELGNDHTLHRFCEKCIIESSNDI